MFISEREFVICKTCWKEENGTIISIATSIEDNENYPEGKKYVRATVFFFLIIFI